jgi:hypothetical protein
MSQSRKTFNVGDFLWKVNFRLEHSKPEQLFERQEAASLLESVLHATGNYKGFTFLNMVHNPGGMSPTIPDDSRRFYFIHRNLVADYNAAEKRYKEVWGDEKTSR